MSSHTLRRLRGIALLPILLFHHGCGGDGATGPGDGGTVPLTISLSTSSVVPPDAVGILGIPPGLDVGTVFAEFTTEGGTRYRSPLGRRSDGIAFMVSPLHADHPADGGRVTVRVTNAADITSNSVPLDISGLPAATVTIQEIVTRLQSLMDARLELHGRTREELRGLDPRSMTSLDYPLFIAQEILDSPRNPNSLRASVDGPVPFFGNEPLDFDLADRLVSRVGLGGFLSEESDSVLVLLQTPGPSSATEEGDSPRAPRDRTASLSQAAGCIASEAEITTASGLHRAMELARFSARRLDGASGTVVQDAAAAFSALGVVPTPQTKATSKVLGGIIYVYALLNEASSKLLPSEFDNSRTQFSPHPAVFPEDGTLGYWDSFLVTAVSEGWELDEDVLKALLRIAKFEDLGGVQWFDDLVASEFGKNLANYLLSETVKALITAAAGGEGGILRVCPGTWSDIDCTFPQWSKVAIVSGSSIGLRDEHNAYEPIDIGVSQLRVETHPARFGGALAFRIQPIEVKRISVVVEPTFVRAETREILTFTATVEHADDPRFRWILPPGFSIVDGFGNTIVIQAPSTPWDTATLTARSISNFGLREGKAELDPRDGIASIRNQDEIVIRIEPRYECISAGQSTTFQAIVEGLEEYTVIWKRVSGFGTIDQTGRYQAPPQGLTEAVISAEVEGHPEAVAYATVRVGACECTYLLDVVGATFHHSEGGDVAYSFAELPDNSHNYQFFFELNEPGGPSGASISMNLGPSTGGQIAPFPGQTGSYEVSVAFVGPGGLDAWVTDSTATVTLEILEHTESYMIANFQGAAAQGSEPNRTLISISGSFRAGRWFGGEWPCD